MNPLHLVLGRVTLFDGTHVSHGGDWRTAFAAVKTALAPWMQAGDRLSAVPAEDGYVYYQVYADGIACDAGARAPYRSRRVP